MTGLLTPSDFRSSGAGKGITTLELMVVLVIVALLATLAVPRFTDTMVRSRRADAMISLQRIASEQEKFYFDNHVYAATLDDLGVLPHSEDGYYTLSIAGADAFSFIARAVPVDGSSQAGDGGFELHSGGGKGWDPGEDGTYECSWNDAGRGIGC